MARALYLVDVLRAAGLKVLPFRDWETRGGSQFNPVGVMWHHTATRPTSSDAAIDLMLAETGSSKVPAPLCNYSTNRDGSISVIAAGTANHGGVGSWEGYTGNSRFFGDEMKNAYTVTNPPEPWPKVQLEAARLATAALLDHLGASTEMLCGHKEYALPPGRKPDPHTLDMDAERHNVEALREDGQVSEADRMTEGDVNAAIDWNKAFGQMPQSTQQALMAKLVKMAQTYPETPAAGGGGIPPGTIFTAETQ